MIGADLVVAPRQGRQQLTHNLEPAVDTSYNQAIDQRSAQDEVAIDAACVIEGANFGWVGDQHHVNDSGQADAPRHHISSLLWATERSCCGRSSEWDGAMGHVATAPRASRFSPPNQYRGACRHGG